MRALAKEPEKRPDSAEAMVAELARVRESGVVTQRRAGVARDGPRGRARSLAAVRAPARGHRDAFGALARHAQRAGGLAAQVAPLGRPPGRRGPHRRGRGRDPRPGRLDRRGDSSAAAAAAPSAPATAASVAPPAVAAASTTAQGAPAPPPGEAGRHEPAADPGHPDRRRHVSAEARAHAPRAQRAARPWPSRGQQARRHLVRRLRLFGVTDELARTLSRRSRHRAQLLGKTRRW